MEPISSTPLLEHGTIRVQKGLKPECAGRVWNGKRASRLQTDQTDSGTVMVCRSRARPIGEGEENRGSDVRAGDKESTALTARGHACNLLPDHGK